MSAHRMVFDWFEGLAPGFGCQASNWFAARGDDGNTRRARKHVPRMESRPRNAIVAERVLEATREIGILLIAFAPLDFAVSDAPIRTTWPYLSGFLLIGLAVLISSILVEWRFKPWLDSS